mgnify:CR=1 FL=1
MIRFLTGLSYSMEMKDWTIWHNGNRKQINHSKKLKKVLLFIYPLVVLILKMSVDLIIYHNVWTKIISFSLQLSIVFFSTVFKTYLLQCRALDICICLKKIVHQVGEECFCGNYLKHSSKRYTSECLMPCKGNKGEGCGGHWRVVIYRNNNYKCKSLTWLSFKMNYRFCQ